MRDCGLGWMDGGHWVLISTHSSMVNVTTREMNSMTLKKPSELVHCSSVLGHSLHHTVSFPNRS